jgi:hypothetical protein
LTLGLMRIRVVLNSQSQAINAYLDFPRELGPELGTSTTLQTAKIGTDSVHGC